MSKKTNPVIDSLSYEILATMLKQQGREYSRLKEATRFLYSDCRSKISWEDDPFDLCEVQQEIKISSSFEYGPQRQPAWEC